MTTAYATPAELKLAIEKTDSTHDSTIQMCLDAAAQVIDRFTNRLGKSDAFKAETTASARTYTGMGGYYQWIDECISISLVEVKDSPDDTTYVSWLAADWVAFSGDPKRPNFNKLPYEGIMVTPTGDQQRFTSGQYVGRRGFRPDTYDRRGVVTIRVTAKWGYALDVPPAIKAATLAQATRWWKRYEGAFGDTLATGEMGTLMFMKELDPDIAMMLRRGRFIRPPLIGGA